MGERIETARRGPEPAVKSPGDARCYNQLKPLEQGIAELDPAARDRAAVVLWPIVDSAARALCRRIGHRGGPCRGVKDSAEHPYDAIRDAGFEQLLGAVKGPRPKLLDWLRDPSRCALDQFVRGRMQPRDASEASRRERGIVQRPRGAAIDRLVDRVSEAFADATVPTDVRTAADLLGFSPEADTEAVFRALFEDACEPAPGAIDPARLRRHLDWSVPGLADHAVEALVHDVAAFVDRSLADADPEAYDKWLVHPRSMTRPPQESLWSVELGTVGGIADEGDRQLSALRLSVVVWSAHEQTGRPFRELLREPALTEPCGFEPDDLDHLRARDEDEIRLLLAEVLTGEAA